LFDQQACPLLGRLRFRRSITFDVDERGYERDLKLDRFAAPSPSRRVIAGIK
jgi:hypothetical protein